MRVAGTTVDGGAEVVGSNRLGGLITFGLSVGIALDAIT
jgi:hypothetical protein